MHRPITRSVVLLLLAAGGCSFGAGDDRTTTTAGPSPERAARSRTASPVTSWSPAGLEKLLLTAGEVGTGFTGGPPTSGSGPSTGGGTPALCSQARYDGPAATVSAQVQYLRSQAGPTVSETLMWFGDGGAEQSVAFFATIPAVCGTFTTESPQGTVTYQITAQPSPVPGDTSTAFRISAKTASIPIAVLGDVVLVRHERFVVTIMHLNPLRVDEALTRTTVEQAVQKVEEAT